MSIETLHWDTEFFGYPIGKVTINDELKFEDSDTERFALIYFFVAPENVFANRQLTAKGAILVDEKVTFHKFTAPQLSQPASIYTYYRSDPEKDKDVIRIGIQSGAYSRFNVDPNFMEKDFRRLYELWINRSIDREIAKEVFVSVNDGRINGMITVGEKSSRLDVGILAVDESARGKQTGSKLIQKAEQYAFDNNYKELQVVTQKANATACHFYSKCGFSIESVLNVYHLWNKKAK